MELNSIVILADESANWQIAGLPQLQRLALALNEFAATRELERKLDIFVFWKPTLPVEQRSISKDAPLSRCDFHLIDGRNFPDAAPVLSTRLVVSRGALADVISVAPTVNRATNDWDHLARGFADVCRNPGDRWLCVNQPDDIPAAERWLLRSSDKPQDGFISKAINRPVSRALSRTLLKSSITPRAWTLSIFALPIIAFVFLQRGNYVGLLVGAALFQIFSMLDGCDGEIARAKYLESESGRRLDNFCDVAGNVLFALGLGLGLQRMHHGWYLVEGILCATALAANEGLLAGSPIENDILDHSLYPRHRVMLQRAGLLFLGEKFLYWIFQLTKRDVAIFFFLLLAIAGRAQWILHLWSAVAGVSFLAALTARLRAR